MGTSSTTAYNISVRRVLELLDSDFERFAENFADGKFNLWVGSGISRNRHMMLRDIIERITTFLIEKSQPGIDSDRHSQALSSAFKLAGVDQSELEEINQPTDFKTWPKRSEFIDGLVQKYDEFLSIEVSQEESDYLLWTGADVAQEFSDPSKAPDVEHLLIAALILEGAIREVYSANWDDLIERAFQDISQNGKELRTCVTGQDLKDLGSLPMLAKVHGCAAKAKESPETYRSLLISRQSQIDQWKNKPTTQAIRNKMMSSAQSGRTLVLGLSLQDHNLRGVQGDAASSGAWDWEAGNPAIVFSEEGLSSGQQASLENIYPKDYTAKNRDEIKKNSIFKAYAKAFLIGLLLEEYRKKMFRFLNCLQPKISEAQMKELQNGVTYVRNLVADQDPGEEANEARLEFTQSILSSMSRSRSIFDFGEAPKDGQTYLPLSQGTTSDILPTAEIEKSGLIYATAALGMIGSGLKDAGWTAALHEDTCISLKRNDPSATQPTDVFLAANELASFEIEQNFSLNDDTDAILLVCQPRTRHARLSRSPTGKFDRNPNQLLRKLYVSELIEDSDDTSKLLDAFRMEALI